MNSFLTVWPLDVFRGIKDWKVAKNGTSKKLIELLTQNKVELGTSLSLEELEGLALDGEQLKKTLNWYVKVLKISHFRLGFRWNQISKSRENIFDFTYYYEFCKHLELLSQSYPITFTLNIGPIKVFRWPEQHVPNWVREISEIPKKLEIDSGITLFAYEHAERLSKYLLKTFPALLQCTTHVQLDNESVNPFGLERTTVSIEYIEGLLTYLPTSFLTKRFLWNSAGTFDGIKITKIITSLPQLRHTFGVDYYYTQDILSKMTWTRVFDAVSVRPFAFTRSRKITKEGVVDVQITEAQMELWGRAAHPGSNLREFYWTCIRCLRFKPPEQEKFLISLWGLEHLASRSLGIVPYVVPFSKNEDTKIIEVISSVSK